MANLRDLLVGSIKSGTSLVADHARAPGGEFGLGKGKGMFYYLPLTMQLGLWFGIGLGHVCASRTCGNSQRATWRKVTKCGQSVCSLVGLQGES